jgi:hypothetical protein
VKALLVADDFQRAHLTRLVIPALEYLLTYLTISTESCCNDQPQCRTTALLRDGKVKGAAASTHKQAR